MRWQMTVPSQHQHSIMLSTLWLFLASRSMVAQELSSPLCKDGCNDTAFCGQDGICHAFNCINLYAYGPETVTGHDYDDPTAPKLLCTSEPPPQSSCLSPWPLLIYYHCTLSRFGDYVFKPSCPVDYMDGRYATLNRYCSAQPNPYQNFSCYDLDPNTIPYGMEYFLADYLDKVRLDSVCTAANLPYQKDDQLRPNETDPYTGTNPYTGSGHHSYQTCIDITQWHTDCSLVWGVHDHYNDTELQPLDFEKLRHVMMSYIRGEIPTASATPSMAGTSKLPGTASTTTTILASALATWTGWTVLL